VPTLYEYFQRDLRNVNKLDSFPNGAVKADDTTLTARAYSDFEACIRYRGYWVPAAMAGLPQLTFLLTDVDAIFTPTAPFTVNIGFQDVIFNARGLESDEFPYSPRMLLYVDAVLSAQVRAGLAQTARAAGLILEIRDQTYAVLRDRNDKRLAFISHDSRNKDLVRPLAESLRSLICPVWYDEFALTPGMSLRKSIDVGLRDTERCIVVLSPEFIGNDGWPAFEFDGAFGKHVKGGGNVIIPVWHNVSYDDVFNYSPMVANLFALNSSIGLDKLTEDLFRTLIPEAYVPATTH
jgi:hypothetical protein